MIDTVIGTMLVKHSTGCLTTPANCGESVAPNISANLVVWVSPINTYKPQSSCFDINTGGATARHTTSGTITAGATTVTLNAVNGMSSSAPTNKFSWFLDNGTEVLQTITDVTGSVVTFSPAIAANRSVASGSTTYSGDGAGQASTASLAAHAVAAGYSGLSSVSYGPNGSGASDAFYPTLASADAIKYPFGPLDATKTPSDLGGDFCHPSVTGSPALGTQLSTFIDAQAHL